MAVGSADFLVSLWDLNDMSCHHTAQIFEYVPPSPSPSPFPLVRRFAAWHTVGWVTESLLLRKEILSSLSALFPPHLSHLSQCDALTGAVETTVDCRGALMALSWHPKHDLIAIAPDINPNDEDSRHRGAANDKFVRLLNFN